MTNSLIMTNPNLELRKSSIMAQLAVLQDESVVTKIEEILTPQSDWWDELSSGQKKSIERGIQQLDNGESISYADFIAKYKASR